MKPLITTLLLSLSSLSLASQVYVCTGKDGAKTFQQVPCGASQKSEQKTYEAVTVGTSMKSENLLENRKRLDLESDIQYTKDRIESYQRSMDAELAGLSRQKNRANNNLAGATWENSISSEMQAVTAKWSSKIEIEQSRLARLYQEQSARRGAQAPRTEEASQ